MNRVDFQLKSSTDYAVRDGEVIYDLRVEDYNRLTADDGLPRALILYTMPSDDSLWLSQSEDELCLRKCAYWVSLMGMSRSSNVSTQRVRLPLSNVFKAVGCLPMRADCGRGARSGYGWFWMACSVSRLYSSSMGSISPVM